MRVVILGAGFGAIVHAPNVRSRADLSLVGICDGGSGSAIRATATGEQAFHDWCHALDAVGDGIAIVATPPATHEELALAAIRRGLHVLIEKPAGLRAANANCIAKAARSCGVVVGVNFQFRFEPFVERMRDRLRTGFLGALREFEIRWHTGGRSGAAGVEWQNFGARGGGILMSHMCHVFDLVHWLGGAQIVSASGEWGRWAPFPRDTMGATIPDGAEDHVICHFRTKKGVVGSSSVSNAQPGGDGLSIRVLAEGGIAVFRHVPPFRLSDQSLELRSAALGTVIERGEAHAGDTRGRAAARVLEAFVDTIRTGASTDLPTIDDAAAALQVIESMKPFVLAGDGTVRGGLPT